MSIQKQDAARLRQPSNSGDRRLSGTLDASVTVEMVSLAISAAKVTVQSIGTLAGTVEYSANGQDFFGSAAFAANTPVSYDTHNVVALKITRTAGSGKLSIVAI